MLQHVDVFKRLINTVSCFLRFDCWARKKCLQCFNSSYVSEIRWCIRVKDGPMGQKTIKTMTSPTLPTKTQRKWSCFVPHIVLWGFCFCCGTSRSSSFFPPPSFFPQQQRQQQQHNVGNTADVKASTTARQRFQRLRLDLRCRRDTFGSSIDVRASLATN